MLAIKNIGVQNSSNTNGVGFKGKIKSDSASSTPISQQYAAKIPASTFQAYNNISFGKRIGVEFILPEGKTIPSEILRNIHEKALHSITKAIEDPRCAFDLPEEMLQKGIVEQVYKTVNKFKSALPGDPNAPKEVAFVGLGNPGTSLETATALGVEKNAKLVDNEINMQNFLGEKEIGDKVIAVFSSSGSTYDTRKAVELAETRFTEFYREQGIAEDKIPETVAKHFLCLTGSDPAKSILKAEATKKGFTTIDFSKGHSSCTDVHTDTVLLALLGLPKEKAEAMVKGAAAAAKKVKSQVPYENNSIAQMAAMGAHLQAQGTKAIDFITWPVVDISGKIRQIGCEGLHEKNLTTLLFPTEAHRVLESAFKAREGEPPHMIMHIVPKNATESTSKLGKAHEIALRREGHYITRIDVPVENGPYGKITVDPATWGEFLIAKNALAVNYNAMLGRDVDALFNMNYVNGYKGDLKTLLTENK